MNTCVFIRTTNKSMNTWMSGMSILLEDEDVSLRPHRSRQRARDETAVDRAYRSTSDGGNSDMRLLLLLLE